MVKTKKESTCTKKCAMQEQKAKAIIFDFDDTLVDTKRVAAKKHITAAKRLNMEFDEKEFFRRYGQPWPKLLFDMIGKDAQALADEVRLLNSFALRQIEGANGAIDYACRNGFFVGLLSSSERDWVLKKSKEASINLAGFQSRLICCGDEVKENKPSPLAFEPIISALAAEGLGPGDIYYLGDHTIDMETASRSGVNFIAVTTGITTADDFLRAGLKKNMIISSVKELPSKLDELKLI